MVQWIDAHERPVSVAEESKEMTERKLRPLMTIAFFAVVSILVVGTAMFGSVALSGTKSGVEERVLSSVFVFFLVVDGVVFVAAIYAGVAFIKKRRATSDVRTMAAYPERGMHGPQCATKPVRRKRDETKDTRRSVH